MPSTSGYRDARAASAPAAPDQNDVGASPSRSAATALSSQPSTSTFGLPYRRPAPAANRTPMLRGRGSVDGGYPHSPMVTSDFHSQR